MRWWARTQVVGCAVLASVVSLAATPVSTAAATGGNGDSGDTRFVHPPAEESECLGCHQSARVEGKTHGTFRDLPPEAELAHWWFGCSFPCHDMHGTTNLSLIAEVIQTPNSGLRDVVFLNQTGANSYADGDAVYDGVCEVCHTLTDYHRNDTTGDQTHYPGQRCAGCHVHGEYFQPVGVENHPQAVTDCSNCHLNPVTGEPDLLGVHDLQCTWCHTVDFDSTFLGPLGTWLEECTECHNPGVAETGNLETPTNGHRCVLCHGGQRQTTGMRSIHRRHMSETNCVVCHGFIPDVGTEIGSGNRDICELCHSPGQHGGIDQQDFHKRHVPDGASCLECHGDVRPPVDVVDGPPVGSSSNVCEICHDDQSPGDFVGESEREHERHTDDSLDCGACHAQAELQDDREPMPPIDDPVRALVDRAGYAECHHCHEGGESGSPEDVHHRHVADQWQWCFNCHEPTDPRPPGQQPPVTAPAESCSLCHTDESYSNTYPFNVHRQHSGKNKCYACHQLDPALFGWPDEWMQPDLSLNTSFADVDVDVHGDPWVMHLSIDLPPGFVPDGTDCNDSAGLTFPGAQQVCDGVNNDCDDPGWPGLAGTNEFDDDGDTFSECAGDCDDSSAATHPGAYEVNDGLDNQCPGDAGHGLADEITGGLVFSEAGDGFQVAWPPQDGAASYEFARASSKDFSTGVVRVTTSQSLADVSDSPSPGAVFHFLVRAETPNPGSWGATSGGVSRTVP